MKDIYVNPAWTGTADGALFSHYEIDRVVINDEYAERDDTNRELREGEREVWTIYGRFDPAVANGFGGVDALVDADTYEQAKRTLGFMIGNLDQHRVQ